MKRYDRDLGLPRAPREDSGFTLVETMISIAIIGVVMTALSTFFITTTTILNQQRGLQMAVRLAHDGVELVRSLPGSSINLGRSLPDVQSQLTTDVVPKIDPVALLKTMSLAFDPKLTVGSSVNPLLPVVPEALKVNDVTFSRHWFVGSCTQDPMTPGGACGLTGGTIAFYRVIVAVTWQNQRACNPACSYVTSTLVSSEGTEPVFNPGSTVVPPLPDNPGNQVSEVSVPITPITLTATTVNPPLTWSASSLPAGITINNAGVISGTPTTAGISVVRVVVTDKESSNDASFNWTVNALPTLTTPADQFSDAGTAVSFAVPLVGGTPALGWVATGLPTGLTISPTTGLITGSSKVSGAPTTVKVTVTDKYGKKSIATFRWGIRLAVLVPAQAATKGTAYSTLATAGGGTTPYTWTAVNLPPGLSISSAGAITGTVTGSTRYLSTLKVTDKLGATSSALVPFNITVNSGLAVTAPTLAAPDSVSAKGTPVTQTSTASGGTAPYTWTAAGLPPGLSGSPAGMMTGTPTTPGTYPVTLTVTDSAGATSVFMLTWTIS